MLTLEKLVPTPGETSTPSGDVQPLEIGQTRRVVRLVGIEQIGVDGRTTTFLSVVCEAATKLRVVCRCVSVEFSTHDPQRGVV